MHSLNLFSLQARGRAHEAVGEVRALLDFLRENQESVHKVRPICQDVLVQASRHLRILDPVLGQRELINAVAAELAKLRRV